MTIDGEFEDEEKGAINELRKRMNSDMEPELLEDDYLFYRFLRARDFNVDNAEVMLRKHLKWRERYDVKNILNHEKREITEKYIPLVSIGHDKEGCVVRYSNLGGMDVKGVCASLTSEEMAEYTIYEMELDAQDLKRQSEKLGRRIDKCIYIHNLDHFTFAKATDKQAVYHLLFFMDMYVNNYPERMKAAYVLNVSMYFNIMFSMVKGVLPKSIMDKIHLYSDDSYKEDLLKVIDADVLPVFLGGNRTDPDGNPSCLTFIKYGETVPEKYYMSKRKEALTKAADVRKVTLSRAAFHEVSIEVEEPGSYLEWEFETKCRDIGFGLFYEEDKNGEPEIVEIVPIQRIDTEAYPETGTFKCDRAGKYVIVFDNTYSWVRSKEIYFRVKVVAPKEHESAQIVEEGKGING